MPAPGLVFYVVFTIGVSQVDERHVDWPKKDAVMFRNDPAVVVVSLNWWEKASDIGADIHRQIATKYVDHEDRVRVRFVCTTMTLNG